jgi:hypothetical protein
MSSKTRHLVIAAALLAVSSTSVAAPVTNNASWAALATMSSTGQDGQKAVADRAVARTAVVNRGANAAGVSQYAPRGAWLYGGGIVPVGGFIAAQILLYLFSDTELHGHPRGVSPG